VTEQDKTWCPYQDTAALARINATPHRLKKRVRIVGAPGVVGALA